jgi:16S rRNA (guanine966-N2)-methyltransferase
MNLKANQLRIIGGRWRGRKISFPDAIGLRPTPDRVRETVFNWLGSNVIDSTCLDLFAGSGALGFEALSRGAKHITLVDNSIEVVKYLKTTVPKFEPDNIRVKQQDALSFLTNLNQKFDIVFLDPPFHKNLLAPCINILSESAVLKPTSLIYIESEPELQKLTTPWNCIKNKKAGNVIYRLFSPANT